jgi:benzoyl-CoA reductase/2-hydroxyglutaryl-CoA dehydratase subunit BcrC/BadD/HgdB
MVYSLPNAIAFYPDGAWWVPCVMELGSCLTAGQERMRGAGQAGRGRQASRISRVDTAREPDEATRRPPQADAEVPAVRQLPNEGCLAAAAQHGLDESFCPVRAMFGAFVTETQFPRPDLLVCSVGATCDDFSAIAQRLEAHGFPILWWEMPARRHPDPGEEAVSLPGGGTAPASQVAVVAAELQRIRASLETLTGRRLDDDALRAGIRAANAIRRVLARLRRLVFCAEACPLPALELLIAEMLAIHFCSDRAEALAVLQELLAEVERRVVAQASSLPGAGKMPALRSAARVFWVNPVADLAAMNLLEACGARLCGTDFMFAHALDEIPEDLPPLEALARTALADPMVGPARDRAERICRDAKAFGAEAVVVSRIPGASHCALEGSVIAATVRERLGLPVVEVEVPPVSDALGQALRTRLEALVESVMARRGER